MNVIGIDVGGTKISGTIFDLNGNMIDKKIHAVQGKQGYEVGKMICNTYRELAGNYPELKISAMGISVPGIVYASNGKVWAPNLNNWDNFPLKDFLNKNLKTNKVKICIESDRACYILGEVWKGSARGCKNAIFIAFGTGIGAGILMDGIILRGHSDIAGAIGWFALNMPFEKKYKNCGQFEYFCSGEGLVRLTKEIISHKKKYDSVLKKLPVERITTRDLFDAYNKKDELAIMIMDEAIRLWGMASANLISVFNPEKIIFGGGVFGPALEFLDLIYKEAEKWAQPVAMKNVTFTRSLLAGDAGLYGAGFLALKSTRK